MNKIPTILLLLGLLLLQACQRPDYPHTLQQAESVMNARPDSALQLLQGMADSLAMLPEEAQMYYHLLTIQVKDKLYITHTSDSLINRIVSFYENYGDKDRLMMAYFYQGRVYRDMNDAPRALKALQQAEKIESSNWGLLTKVYSQMGYLFSSQGLCDEAIRVNKVSISLYQKSRQEDKAYFAFRDIARNYEAKNMNDSALFFYEKCYNIAHANKDSAKYYNTLAELGRLYYNTDQINKAKKILLDLWHYSTIKDKSHIHLTLGYIYKEQEQWDSAHFHFQNVLPTGNIYKQYYSQKSLFNIEIEKGNYLQASKHANNALNIKERIDQTVQTEATAKINSLYNYQHIAEENYKLKLMKERSKNINLALTIALMALLFLSLLLLFHQKNVKKKYRTNKLKLKALQEKIQEKSPMAVANIQKEIHELESSLTHNTKQEEESEKQMVLLKLQHLKLRHQEIQLSIEQQKLALQTLKQTDIYKLFRHASLGEDIKIGVKHWNELQTEIKKVYPNFIFHLKELHPSITDVETRICLLSKLSMPQSHIANVLKYTRGGISLACERFYKKIFGVKCTAKEFAHFIEEI